MVELSDGVLSVCDKARELLGSSLTAGFSDHVMYVIQHALGRLKDLYKYRTLIISNEDMNRIQRVNTQPLDSFSI